MSKQAINPNSLFPSVQFGFSQIMVSEPGRTVYLSGQVAWDETQNIVGEDDFRAQTWQSFKNVERAMAEAGGSLEDVVLLRIYVVDPYLEQGNVISEALKAFFPGDNPPVSTWLGIQRLANTDFLIEVEAIGVIS